MESIMNIAVLDNDEKTVQSVIEAVAVQLGESVRLYPFFDCGDLVGFLRKDGVSLDLLICEIELEKCSGIELAAKLCAENRTLDVIYVSGEPERFFEDIFERTKPIGFFRKPIKTERLLSIVKRKLCELSELKKTVTVMCCGEKVTLLCSDISYVESLQRKILFHCGKSEFAVYMTISEAADLLGCDFIRCHRGCLVNLRAVSSLCECELILKDGTKIPVSRRNLDETKKALLLGASV